jgi:hypothetical protein
LHFPQAKHCGCHLLSPTANDKTSPTDKEEEEEAEEEEVDKSEEELPPATGAEEKGLFHGWRHPGHKSVNND